MITRGFERVWQPVENAITLVKDRRSLPVHQSGGPHHLTTKDMTDALVSKADPQDRYSGPELPDELVADPCIQWRTRAGGDANTFRPQFFNFVQSDFVVSTHGQLRPQLAKILHEV